MKALFGNKAIGFYLAAIAAVLAVLAIAFYPSVMYQSASVKPLLIGCVAMMVLSTGLSAVMGDKRPFRSVTILNAVLMTFAAMKGLSPMVNQIGFVVAGLEGFQTLTRFIIFEALCLGGILLNVVASFVRYAK